MPVIGRRPPACGMLDCHSLAAVRTPGDMVASNARHAPSKRSKAAALLRFMNGMPNRVRSV